MDDEQERRQLFESVWGDSPDAARPPRSRSGPRADDVGSISPAPISAGRIDELERQVRELRESLEALRQTTEEGFGEMRRTMLRLAEAVQASTQHGPPIPRA